MRGVEMTYYIVYFFLSKHRFESVQPYAAFKFVPAVGKSLKLKTTKLSFAALLANGFGDRDTMVAVFCTVGVVGKGGGGEVTATFLLLDGVYSVDSRGGLNGSRSLRPAFCHKSDALPREPPFTHERAHDPSLFYIYLFFAKLRA